MVLEYNPTTGEPYIRLPAPLSHIIVTPPRLVPADDVNRGQDDRDKEMVPPETDVQASVTGLNDSRIFMYLEGPPYPYKREQAIAYTKEQYANAQRIITDQHHQKQRDLKQPIESDWFDGCPFRDIRDTTLSSSLATDQKSHDNSKDDQLVESAPKVGDLLFSRYPFYELPLGSEERQKAREYNDSLPAGHEDLIWCIGCRFRFHFHCPLILSSVLSFFLSFSRVFIIRKLTNAYFNPGETVWLLPTHHKKGIMSAVLNTLIHDWAIPKMNARVIKASALAGNEASVGVFRKCGFVIESMIEKAAILALTKPGGGVKKDIYVLRWERTD